MGEATERRKKRIARRRGKTCITATSDGVTKKPASAATKQEVAQAALDPGLNAAGVVERYGKAMFGHLGEGLTVQALWEQADTLAASLNQGNMRGVEDMLAGQALALQTIFVNLSIRAQDIPGQLDGLLRLAFKAQSQCRTTLETLAEIKHPKAVAFVRQANISHGHQQVNNGPRAQETPNQSNELLAVTHEQTERLDFGAPRKTTASHQTVEAVGTVNRTKKRSRKGSRRP